MRIRHILSLLAALAVSFPSIAASKAPYGVLAASVGDSVVLLEASTGGSVEIETGPVGWLFPAPGGIVFAPDVINNRTTVINVRTQRAADLLDGLTMPHFGSSSDRYIAIAGDVLILSYPDRAILGRVASKITHPWQAEVTPDGSAILILERLPDGSTGVHMSTVNLITHQVAYRRELSGDVRHMALSSTLGLLALADAGAQSVHLVAPASLAPIAKRPSAGRPVDVVFAHGESVLATAVDLTAGGGTLDLARFKIGKKGLRLSRESTVALPANPVRIAASPDGRHVAVALQDGVVVIVDVDDRKMVAEHRLPGTPRDLRWCDPAGPGPTLPEWSDGRTDDGADDPYVPRVTDDTIDGR